MSEESLLVFAKAPEPGRVKTRLVPPLTPEQASAVHRASVRDVVARAREVNPGVGIRYDAVPGAAAYFANEFRDLDRRPQRGGDLGHRLEHAFAGKFDQGAEHVAIIGSDSPTLPEEYLRQAFKKLRAADVALGPAADGGYYLIAIRRSAWPAARALFRNMPWSTAHVLTITLEYAADLDLRLDLLPLWYDIDRVDDLRLARVDAREDSHLGRYLAGVFPPHPERALRQRSTWKRRRT